MNFLNKITESAVQKAIKEYDRDPVAFFKRYRGFRKKPRSYWIEHDEFGTTKYATRPILAAAYAHAVPRKPLKKPAHFKPTKIGNTKLKRALKRLRFHVVSLNTGTGKNKGGSTRQPNPIKRQAVEHAATAEVERRYSPPHWKTTDVSDKCKGWDLEARKVVRPGARTSPTTLLLEVKGVSGSNLSVELTPNEYEMMKGNPSQFRVCIVKNALDKTKRKLHVFRFVPKRKCLVDEQGLTLGVKETLAARLS